jgi:60 kDa SS-A/Ro ribonucleoprotein
MADALKSVSTRSTPQSQPAGGATAKNAAGGYVFGIDAMAQLRRFLTLGTTGGTYYTTEQKLTRENADVVISLAKTNPVALVDTLTEISVAGRAPKVNPAIFALAVAASEADEAGRAYALSKLPEVIRTGTHMYLFSGYVENFRGWGPALRRAVAGWYNGRSVEQLAYQVLKYRQREGWRHADLLALSHPKPNDPLRDHLYRYIVDTMTQRDGDRVESIRTKHRAVYQSWDSYDEKYGRDSLPELVNEFIEAQAATKASEWTSLIDRGHGLSWEMLPDAALTNTAVWESLIDKGLPQTALMRQLPRLTRLGLLNSSAYVKVIANQLADPELLKKGRVHPINVLVAARTYASGQSARGDSTWAPHRAITDAFDRAFYAAYGAVEPCGKRLLLALDVSGSMGSAAGGLPISCREACAALALVTLNVEKDCEVIGFSDGGQSNRYGFGSNSVATRLDISPRRRLDDVCSYTASLGFGRTDCSLPMQWATKEKLDFDAIWTLTDNETWFGSVHPWQALKSYREKYGPTQYGVVAMTATGRSIADPNDPSQIDISGFDTSVPQVISQFSAGLV